jgi:ABC-type transport system involved in multi-copper enzyme maturation permease subunit
MTRPGGLTALAVFNFLGAATALLGTLGYVMAMGAGDQLVGEEQQEAQRELSELSSLGTPTLLALIVATLLVAGLQVASGIGFLKMRYVLGWVLGFVYGTASLALTWIVPLLRGSATAAVLQQVFYPVVVMTLLATVFRGDFRRARGLNAVPDLGPAPTAGKGQNHILLVAVYSVRFALRTGGGVIFLCTVLWLGLVAGGEMISQVEHQLAGEGPAGEAIQRIVDAPAVRNVIGKLVGQGSEQMDYLLLAQPALLSAILLILLIIVPFSACFAGFNQTAGDIGSKGLRYLLLRTERSNIYFGRFLGTFVFSAVSLAILMTVLVAYLQIKVGAYRGEALWGWAAQGYLAILVLALPHLALSAWISGALASPFISLLLCMLAVGGPIAMLLAIKSAIFATGGDLEWLMLILPWGWKYDLLAKDLGVRLLAIGVLGAYTAALLTLGYRHFRRRDL